MTLTTWRQQWLPALNAGQALDDALAVAVTHKSVAGAEHYEQLEFVGDRVLGLAVAAWLREVFPAADEGELSLRHTALVRQATLVQVAENWGIRDLVRLGPGEGLQPSVLADVVEAMLGAVFTVAGFAAAADLVRRSWAEWVRLPLQKDAKTRLQEWLQARGAVAPEYVVREAAGADHAKTFVLEARALGRVGIGTGPSKAAAGAAAAADLLGQLEGVQHD